MKKRRWIALSVTTDEALHTTLAEQCPLIAIETPLYPEIRTRLQDLLGIEDYECIEYEKQKCFILKKVRGTNAFDDNAYEIFYFPFSRL